LLQCPRPEPSTFTPLLRLRRFLFHTTGLRTLRTLYLPTRGSVTHARRRALSSRCAT
jgi:hypothetical protein